MQIPFAEQTPQTSEPFDLTNGGCLAWALPADETCAAASRSLLSRALLVMGIPREAIEDIALATSELVTNGLRHGIGPSRRSDGSACPEPGRLELWAYHRLTPESQVVVKVFDPRPDWSRPGPEQADPYAENGRGSRSSRP